MGYNVHAVLSLVWANILALTVQPNAMKALLFTLDLWPFRTRERVPNGYKRCSSCCCYQSFKVLKLFISQPIVVNSSGGGVAWAREPTPGEQK